MKTNFRLIGVFVFWVILGRVMLSLIHAQTADKVMFEDADGHPLDNYTPWLDAHVIFDHPVQFEGYTTVTLDFSLAAPAENMAYGHRSGWTPTGSTSSKHRLYNLPAGRQKHTLLLSGFQPPLDHTMSIWFDKPGVVLYGVTLGAETPTDPPDPVPGDPKIIVAEGTIELQRQVGFAWLKATEICGLIEYVLDYPDSRFHGRTFVLDFGPCPQ